MREIKGKYAEAVIFRDEVESYALAQIQMICDNEAARGCRIRVMPDVHPGKVGTIGLTMTVGESILPNLVGIDIGCGVTIAKLKTRKIEYQKLDTVIRDRIPAGFSIRKHPHRFSDSFDFSRLCCGRHVNAGKAALSREAILDKLFLGIVRGNREWNYSAPHGAGRIMKREDVKNHFTVSDFKKQMKGVYSSCIGKDTLDEAPFAYRSLGDIRDAIGDTVYIHEIITPVYNYKAGGNQT